MIDLFRFRHTFSPLQNRKVLSERFSDQLEIFLQTILYDENLSSFELVYQFLNPSFMDNNQQTSNSTTMKNKSTKPSYEKSWKSFE